MDTAAETKPYLKIVGMQIRNLGPIAKLDLPADGMGWAGKFPDFVLIGGANGGGKTTLLEFLFSGFRLASDGGIYSTSNYPKTGPINAFMDFDVSGPELPLSRFRFLHGSSEIWETEKATGRNYYGLHRYGTGDTGVKILPPLTLATKNGSEVRSAFEFKSPSEMPAVVFIPMGERLVSSPHEKGVIQGQQSESLGFTHRWSPPAKWVNSLEGLLYGARWADLNAKEAGRPQEARNFALYTEAFDKFFNGTKTLKWSTRGDLYVEMAGSRAHHDLSALSSGEKQMIVLVSELLRAWRPGSLIMIDEPEMHLHTAWQLRLWDLLHRLQAERGGQVIVATQSSDLFEVADHRSTVLLGGSLR